MNHDAKNKILTDARAHLETVRHAMRRQIERLDQTLEQDYAAYREITGETEYEDKLRAVAIGRNTGTLREYLQRLEPSPYFARCDLALNNDSTRPYYFAKFPASDLNIYSWTAPFASLRFEEPGAIHYVRPDGRIETGTLERRDQFLVANGQLRFMTSEATTYDRELIYQEHFSTRKDGFMLPEIVSQMERAQDQVIRAYHAGPFVISGPAGSGKTTLALHRIAYLRQAPELEALYPAEDILVFVQDSRTQAYFAQLLPELGINDIRITTFSEWALELLGLKSYFHRIGTSDNEMEQDAYEMAKIAALKAPLAAVYDQKQLPQFLMATYAPFFSSAQKVLLQTDLADHALDRYDLTMLLRATQQRDGMLTHNVEHYKFFPGGKVRTTLTREPLRYALVLVDEFQNYLPEQLRLLKDATAARHRSMIYVGDMAQQTRLGTIKEWGDIGETIESSRIIKLSKVYRNTRQILTYINRLGYNVEIPSGVASGDEVVEQDIVSVAEGIAFIRALPRRPGTTIGVLAKDLLTLERYARGLKDVPEIHCFTIREAQGVEFDAVCLVGVDRTTFRTNESDDLVAHERRQINRDVLYVALTRAISSLYILGTGDLFAHLQSALSEA